MNPGSIERTTSQADQPRLAAGEALTRYKLGFRVFEWLEFGFFSRFQTCG
jgi:hypothetical protein